jgi:hypothetical protein
MSILIIALTIATIILCILLAISASICIVELIKHYMCYKIVKRHDLSRSERKNLIREISKSYNYNIKDKEEEDEEDDDNR